MQSGQTSNFVPKWETAPKWEWRLAYASGG